MAILKYRATFIGMSNYLWELCVNPSKEEEIITEDRAKEIIKQKGLVLTHKCEYGYVYDTPDKAFLKKYRRK